MNLNAFAICTARWTFWSQMYHCTIWQKTLFCQNSTKKRPNSIAELVVLRVEVAGFEPAAFWSRTKRATKLRYTSAKDWSQ